MRKRCWIPLILSLAIFYCSIVLFLVPSEAQCKIFIDLTSPNPRPLLMGLQVMAGGGEGEVLFQIKKIIQDDLVYTGLFSMIEERLFLEPAQSSFNPQNWRPLNADVVAKLSLQVLQGDVRAVLNLYDVNEGVQIFKKEYTGNISFMRTLAHVIARDIYKRFTDKDPPFEAKILYVGEHDGKSSIYIMDWDGARLRRLGIVAETIISPKWAGELRLLVYTTRERDGSWVLKTIDFNTMTQKRIFESKRLTMAGDWLDKNSLLISYTESDNQDLYILDIEGTKLKKLIGGYAIEIDPVLSPDRRSLLFVSDRSGSPQVYMADISGYNIKRLTFQGGYNTSPRWSPDGSAFVYVGNVNGKNQIFIQRLDGSEPQQLTNIGNNEEPAFSPDGRFIAFASDRDGQWRIYIMRFDGSGQRPLTEGYGFSPIWIK